MRRSAAALLLVLAACAGRTHAPADLTRPPPAAAWGPNDAELEWWYVASHSPASGLAFHVAFFKARVPPGLRVLGVPVRRFVARPFHVAHAAVTDLATGERWTTERSDVPWGASVCRGPPLSVGVGGWTLDERADGGFRLRAGPLALELDPGKPRTVHPPGWTEGHGTGRLLYQSATRLPFHGTWRGAPVRGEAWLDHQWGDLVPGATARWSWHGLHLDSGDDVMLYETTRPDGSAPVRVGTWTDAGGTTRPLEEVTMTATARVRGGAGRRYDVAYRVRARDLELTVTPVWARQEFRSRLARLAYWEGPVVVRGVFRGRAVTGVGMGEHFPVPRRAFVPGERTTRP